MKKHLVPIYMIGIALLFGGYIWSSWNGYRILGDDNETTQQQRSGSRGHYFYHK